MVRMEKQDKKINKDDNDLIDKLVGINRVAKVVKGGRRFGFAALVVVGDQRGKVGFGTGKAKEVPEAIKKATDDAKKKLVKVKFFIVLKTGVFQDSAIGGVQYR